MGHLGVGLGDLPGGGAYSHARGVSGDGLIVAGESTGPNGIEVFRWTQIGGMQGLGDLPGGDSVSGANAISLDGSTIIGYSLTAEGTEAFRWTAATGMQSLGELPGGAHFSEALAVSADGSTIVGHTQGPDGQEAFVWTEELGLKTLRERLAAAGADVSEWQLQLAAGVSADGLRIAGTGQYQGSTSTAFFADLAPIPEPAAGALLLIMGAALTCARRRVLLVRPGWRVRRERIPERPR